MPLVVKTFTRLRHKTAARATEGLGADIDMDTGGCGSPHTDPSTEGWNGTPAGCPHSLAVAPPRAMRHPGDAAGMSAPSGAGRSAPVLRPAGVHDPPGCPPAALVGSTPDIPDGLQERS